MGSHYWRLYTCGFIQKRHQRKKITWYSLMDTSSPSYDCFHDEIITPAHSQSGSCGQGTYFSRLRFRSFLWFWNSTGYRRKIYQYMKLVTNLNQLTSHRAGCKHDRWDARRWYSWDLFPSDQFVPHLRGEARARYAFHRDEQRKVRGELIKGVDMWVEKFLLALLLAHAAPFALPSLQTNRRKYKVSTNLPCPALGSMFSSTLHFPSSAN